MCLPTAPPPARCQISNLRRIFPKLGCTFYDSGGNNREFTGLGDIFKCASILEIMKMDEATSIPGKRSPSARCIRSGAGPRARVNAVEKRLHISDNFGFCTVQTPFCCAARRLLGTHISLHVADRLHTW